MTALPYLRLGTPKVLMLPWAWKSVPTCPAFPTCPVLAILLWTKTWTGGSLGPAQN